MDQYMRLRQAIINSELSFAELERLTGIPKSTIQRYAAGKTKKIPMDSMEAIAKAVNVSSSYIMGWEDSPSSVESPPPVASSLDLTAQEEGIVLAYRAADPLDKALVRRVLNVDQAQSEEQENAG